MLTPAEEQGLSGLSLSSRVRQAFHRLDPGKLRAMFAEVREECRRRHVVYLREEQVESLLLIPCPVTMLPDQLGYLHYVTLTLHNSLRRLPELYFSSTHARETLRVTDGEEAWLRECWGTTHQESNPVFGRLDAVVDFSSPMWKDSLRFVEPNMSGIGGLHLSPTCEQILRDKVFPVLRQFDPRLEMAIGPDIRELLMQEMLDHLEVLGRKGRTVCFVEPRFTSSGIDEQEDLANFYRNRYGMTVFHADPTELTIRGDDVCFQGVPIDLAYRDYTVLDLLELQRGGGNTEPMKHLFRENRMVSSIAAELDQKSCWEIFSDPRFREFFSAEERQIFRRHIPWTRILSERATTLADGQLGDLLPHVRADREQLVLKPNRSFGGQGVLIGLATEQAEWEQAIERALKDADRWVVQQLAAIPVNEFPVIDEEGTIHLEPFYVVMGFAPSKYGVGILARASQKQVVNVAQRGGMCAVAIGQPVAHLIGPDQLGKV